MTLAYTENIAMATMMTHFNERYNELIKGASHKSLSQEKGALLPLIFAVTQSNTEIVAMATMITNFGGAHKELSMQW